MSIPGVAQRPRSEAFARLLQDRQRLADVGLAILYGGIFLGYTLIVLGTKVLDVPWVTRDGRDIPGFEPSVVLLSRASIAFVIVCAAALAWRQTRPERAFLVIGGVALAQLAIGEPIRLWDVAMPIALFSVAAHASRAFARLALVVAVLAFVLVAALAVNLPARLDDLPGLLTAMAGPRGAGFAVGFALLILVWVMGDQVRAGRERLERDLERSAAVARQEESNARIGALAERQRIARDLHDVVAHGLSVIIVQADGALYAGAEHPEAPRQALATIAATGRQSLQEMRQILGVLRDEPDSPEPASQPEMAALPALLARFRAAGLDVAETAEGTSRPVPPAVGLTAYRVVQESLTNVLHHAGPTRVDVCVTYGPATLALDVRNRPGNAPARAAAATPGLGLVGMRERVSLLGGSMTAGPTPGGGFRVHVEIPTEWAGGS